MVGYAIFHIQDVIEIVQGNQPWSKLFIRDFTQRRREV